MMSGKLSDQHRDKAAQLIASGAVTKTDIAKQCNISRPTLYCWMECDDFIAAVEHYQKKIERAILKTGIAVKVNRLRAIDDRWERMQRLINARAEDLQHVAGGGDTGMLVRRYKSIGSGAMAEKVEEYEFDAALTKEMREHERQAAEELGQLKDVSLDNHSDLLTSDPSLVSAALPAGALPGGADDYLGIEVSPALQDDSRGTPIVQDGNLREAPGDSVAVEMQDQAAPVDESATIHRGADAPTGEGHLLGGRESADPAELDRENK
jgi:hypothetical protein